MVKRRRLRGTASARDLHRRRCGVCQSENQLDVERAYKAQVPLKQISTEFDVTEAWIKTHARAYPRLEHSRTKNLLAVLDMAIEAAVEQIPKMDFKPQHIGDLVLKRAQVAGTLVHLSADVTKRYADRSDDALLFRAQHGVWPENTPEPDADSIDLIEEPGGRVQ